MRPLGVPQDEDWRKFQPRARCGEGIGYCVVTFLAVRSLKTSARNTVFSQSPQSYTSPAGISESLPSHHRLVLGTIDISALVPLTTMFNNILLNQPTLDWRPIRFKQLTTNHR